MAGYDAKIKELEERIASTKYNKKTQHAIGLYKAQIANLKEREIARSSGKGAAEGYSVRKTGDGTVILIGFPSVGKSTLLNALTNSNSEVGSYAFTTLTVIPGLLKHNYAKIQILDVPGIVKGAASGKGRGKEVLACIRSADLVLVLLDALHPEHLPVILKEIKDTNIRINETKPIVKLVKKAKGGISIGSTVKLTHIDHKTIRAILREFKMSNADVVIRSDITIDQFIDAIEGNKKYVPSITIINKADLVPEDKLKLLQQKIKPDLSISAQKKEHIDELKELIFNKLDLMQVYLKEPGKEADTDVPLIIFRNATVKDLCNKLHKDFVSKFRFTRIWGKSAKFDGQKLMLKHRLKNKDIVEIHLR